MQKEGKNVLEGEYIPLKEQFTESVARHHYSLGYIATYLMLTLRAISMRGVETVLAFFSPLIPNCSKIPTWYSGRLWILKVGYYNLLKPKKKADDWIWLVDHLVQAGKLKCFVVLGIRGENLPKDRPLKKSDMEVLAVLPVETSNGSIVCEQLIELVPITGVPRAIVADHGSDIKLGIEQFCKLTGRNGTIYLYDIKHCIANLLKAELANDGIWNSFLEFAAISKKYLQQTNLAGLMPPNQRSKARYMNLESMVSWGIKILESFDSGDYPTNVDLHKLQCKLGWIPFFREDLKEWRRILDRAIYTETHIRTYGYSKGVSDAIKIEFAKMDDCTRSTNFEIDITQAVLKEELKLHIGEIQLGSTEVLESSFGHYQELIKEQSSSGFTGSILALPAMFSKKTAKSIKAAIEGTTIKQIREWISTNIGQTVQAQRVAWLGKKKTEQKCDETMAI